MELIRINNTKTLSHDEWLKERKRGIGGSDASAILGLNKYKGAFEVYVDKTTDYMEDLSDNEAVYWGTVLEDIVAREFMKRTGKKVEKVNSMLSHPEYEFMLANLDRRIVGENAILECKTTNFFNGKEWDGEDVPASYLCQIQHYMAVTGADMCYIACLVGGQKFIYKTVLKDEEFIKYLIDKEQNFWNENVIKQIPHDIDGSKSALNFLNQSFYKGNGESCSMTSDIEKLCQLQQELKNSKKEIEKQLSETENKIKLFMGDNSFAKGSTYQASWLNVKPRKTLNVDKLKEDYSISDIDNYYVEGKPLRRFNIKGVS